MKTILTYILSLLMAFMFLVSFTGMRMLIHHCFACESTEVLAIGMSTNEDLEDIHHTHHEDNGCHLPAENAISAEAEEKCCHGDQECHDAHCGYDCDSEVEYFRNDYELTQERQEIRIPPPEALYVEADLFPVLAGTDPLPAVIPKPQKDIPPRLAGRDFIIFSRQLKYC